MTINELNILNQHKHQYRNIQKMFFFKSRELLEIEEHLKNTKEQIKTLTLNSRAKLKNSKLIRN